MTPSGPSREPSTSIQPLATQHHLACHLASSRENIRGLTSLCGRDRRRADVVRSRIGAYENLAAEGKRPCTPLQPSRQGAHCLPRRRPLRTPRPPIRPVPGNRGSRSRPHPPAQPRRRNRHPQRASALPQTQPAQVRPHPMGLGAQTPRTAQTIIFPSRNADRSTAHRQIPHPPSSERRSPEAAASPQLGDRTLV